jgi:dTMP kinase
MAFITLEGIEGSGKSTQALRLAAALGPEVVLTFEPGATPLGRQIRGLLLDPASREIASMAEVLLYFADRAQHLAEVVRPALAAGRTVISDRYVDSSIAYQGYGRGLPLADIETLARVATGGLAPDLTLFLDVTVQTGLARVGQRGRSDRLEAEAAEFHERVRKGYLALVSREPKRWVRIDGEGQPEDVYKRLLAAVEARGLVPARHGLR